MPPKWLQNGSKMAPTWLQHKIGPGAVLGASWGHLGACWALGGLLKAIWRPLGRLLERCRDRKSSLERLLATPRGIPRRVSAILGAKRLPKRSPRGSKIEPKRRLELKTRFLQKVHLFNGIYRCLWSWSPFWDVKIDAKWLRIAA